MAAQGANLTGTSRWQRFTTWWNTPDVGIELPRWMTMAGILALAGVVLLQPALVLAVGALVFGLRGLPLTVALIGRKLRVQPGWTPVPIRQVHQR